MKYEYWFARIYGITARKKMKLLEYLGSGQDIYNIEETEILKTEVLNDKEKEILRQARRERDLEKKYQELKDKNIQFIPIYDKRYPEKLCNISSPPYALYVKGQLPEEKKKTVAIPRRTVYNGVIKEMRIELCSSEKR